MIAFATFASVFSIVMLWGFISDTMEDTEL